MEKVKDFWNVASCGEELYLKGNELRDQFENQSRIRYQLEPYILSFAEFEKWKEKIVLEIGVGLGADHQKLAEAGAVLTGIDLTERAIQYTSERFKIFNLTSDLKVENAESLPFEDNTFDLVYSWGVIHHSPDTKRAKNEIYRVLKKGGPARIMIYNSKSIIGYMLWLRYGLFRFRPFISMKEIYSKYLESPGTKAYNLAEAYELFSDFNKIEIETVLTHGDLLSSEAGQRHKGMLLNIAKIIYPRQLIKSLFPKNGLFMLIKLEK